MVEIERANTVRAGFLKISLCHGHAPGVGNPPSGLLPAVSEIIINPKGSCLSNSLWVHLLTANAVFEHGFALKNESGYPVLSKILCKSRPAEATTDDYDIILHLSPRASSVRRFSGPPPNAAPPWRTG